MGWEKKYNRTEMGQMNKRKSCVAWKKNRFCLAAVGGKIKKSGMDACEREKVMNKRT